MSRWNEIITEFNEAIIEYIDPLVLKSLDATQPQAHNGIKTEHMMNISTMAGASIRALTSLSLSSAIIWECTMVQCGHYSQHANQGNDRFNDYADNQDHDYDYKGNQLHGGGRGKGRSGGYRGWANHSHP